MLARHLCRFLGFAACLSLASTLAHAASPSPAGLTSCSAAGCVTAYWGSGQIAAGFGASGFRPGQTFSPGFSGVLNTVRLGIETITGNATNVVAEIRAVSNGVPTTAILGEAPVPGAPYTGGLFYSANFTAQNLVLTAGTRYAITLRCVGHQYVLAAFPPCPTSSGTYDYVFSEDDGQTWSLYFTRDRSFIYEVCMDAATATRASTWGDVKSFYR